MPSGGPLRVFITGASSGIGAALARHYAHEGAILGLVARRKDALTQLAAELNAPCTVHAADVRDAETLAQAARDFIAAHGTPDIVIANAGVSRGTLTRHAEDTTVFRDILDINVLGIVNTFQPFVEPMIRNGSGTLVGIASVAGFRGIPGTGAYAASKAAAITYLEGLRVELRGSGVRVITICPGYIATPMTAHNPFPMPFIIGADVAAMKIARVIRRSKTFAIIPWQMAILGRIYRVLPRMIFDRIFSRTPRKPRGVEHSGEDSA
ncbi:MAG TPA: SDR family oxidoreductase [Burkholderiales bacterium]|nr:SDR family oxidoreductase [Burkholderiales bacterium]